MSCAVFGGMCWIDQHTQHFCLHWQLCACYPALPTRPTLPCIIGLLAIGSVLLALGSSGLPLVSFVRHAMVGIFLGRPANSKQGRSVMQAALCLLIDHFGNKLHVRENNASVLRCKVRQGAMLFTITLTSNTGYIHVQGPSGSLLDFANHLVQVVGGVVYVARAPGASPTNPANEPEPEVSAADVPAEPEFSTSSHSSRPLAAAAGAGAPNDENTEATDTGGQQSTIMGENNIQVRNIIVHARFDNTDAEQVAEAGTLGALVRRVQGMLRISGASGDGHEHRPA